MKTIWSDAFLNDDQKAVAQMARDFANKEIRPKAREIDEKHRYPKEIIAELSQLGFMGIMTSTE